MPHFPYQKELDEHQVAEEEGHATLPENVLTTIDWGVGGMDGVQGAGARAPVAVQ